MSNTSIDNVIDLQNTTTLDQAGKKPTPSSQLGKDDFLKLLVGQMQNQDPMNPMEDKDFMGQLAQFSQLEQTTNMNSTLQNDRAFSLIGRQVKYNDKETGELVSGTVEKVVIDGSTTTLTISGKDGISTDAIREVIGASQTASAPTTPPPATA